jgi:HTH-type transcriptional regulator, competence development regulator
MVCQPALRFELMEFGEILRGLRTGAGLGIKRLAPELGVSYTYLSKLENKDVRPSEDLIRRVARYFSYDEDRLLMSAGRIPEEVLDILREHPEEAVEFLRARFTRSQSTRPQKRIRG